MKHVNAALFVPFLGCPHRCAFCNQVAITGKQTSVTPQDVTEAATLAISSGADTKNGQICFFGGSFTMLDRQTMTALLSAAAPFVERGLFAGLRISTRPDAIDHETLQLLQDYHVTTIELGCQSTDEFVLQKSRRGHTAGDIANACALVKEHGFELGVQMMTGLPGDTPDGAVQTANDLIAFGADVARIYPTLVLRGTELESLWRQNAYQPQTLDEAVALCTRLLALFGASNVPVIRLGLHSDQDLRKNYLAGPFHPAFRELCEGERYLSEMRRILKPKAKGAYTLTVGTPFLSRAVGHQKRNIHVLRQAGYHVKLLTDDNLPLYQIKE